MNAQRARKCSNGPGGQQNRSEVRVEPDLVFALEQAEKVRRGKQRHGAAASEKARDDLNRDERGVVIRHNANQASLAGQECAGRKDLHIRWNVEEALQGAEELEVVDEW